MRKTCKILFALMLLVTFKIKIDALTYGGCDYKTIANLKSLVNNINISYTYEIKNNNAYFNVTLNNVPKNVCFIDSVSKKEYDYMHLNNGEITIKNYSNVQEGQYKFFIKNGVCDGIKLGVKYYRFPIYNSRYKSEVCSSTPNYSLCKRWISKYYSDYEFEKKLLEYKESFNETDNDETIEYERSLLMTLTELYVKYYYYFLPLIIVICSLVIYISKRKNSFRL